jgi:hypothetical protein
LAFRGLHRRRVKAERASNADGNSVARWWSALRHTRIVKRERGDVCARRHTCSAEQRTGCPIRHNRMTEASSSLGSCLAVRLGLRRLRRQLTPGRYRPIVHRQRLARSSPHFEVLPGLSGRRTPSTARPLTWLRTDDVDLIAFRQSAFLSPSGATWGRPRVPSSHPTS